MEFALQLSSMVWTPSGIALHIDGELLRDQHVVWGGGRGSRRVCKVGAGLRANTMQVLSRQASALMRVRMASWMRGRMALGTFLLKVK